ncbi:YjcZ family sporulation protein [Terribacillus saccharophilus]|uniref:YjcZ family sporulation protein n=1 Tax=Terribacillus saccharophilus TaxID=361277 RepID=UPI000C9A25F9|nr:YjcZ family sporulation protein [Terribacillus goriensis]
MGYGFGGFGGGNYGGDNYGGGYDCGCNKGGNGFALIVVLFILLIIVGAAFYC